MIHPHCHFDEVQTGHMVPRLPLTSFSLGFGYKMNTSALALNTHTRTDSRINEKSNTATTTDHNTLQGGKSTTPTSVIKTYTERSSVLN